MGQLAGESGSAAVQAAAEDKAGTDAVAAEFDVNLVRLSAARAEDVLAQGAKVGIIFDQGRAPRPPRQLAG